MILPEGAAFEETVKPAVEVEAAAFFGKKGLLARTFGNYEYRPQQREMAQAVEGAIRSGSHLIVEAGTGVGKSFAYLVPLLTFAVGSNKKALVSTNTISLQEQLLDKDIPFLRSVLPFEFKAALVKGRANYLCLRRLNRSFHSKSDLFETKEELKDLEKIVAWSKVTADGSLSDFDEEPSFKIWEKVCSDSDACLGKKCPYRSGCFFQERRRNIQDADLLVVNHHLFFSDLSLRRQERALLPNYASVVFDEAHTVEDVATEHLGFEASNSKIKFLLDSLYNPLKKKGLLTAIKDGDEARQLVAKTREESEAFFGAVSEWLGEEDAKRVKQPYFIDEGLCRPLKDLADYLADRVKRAKSKEEEVDIKYYLNRVAGMSAALEAFLGQTFEDCVYWAQAAGRRTKRVSLFCAPIDISGVLMETLFSKVGTVILTSATLSTGGDFEFLKKRLGLKECAESLLGSPFDYKNQVKIYVARTMPDPNDYDRYKEKVIEKLKDYIGRTEGKAFVLFTNYRLMDEAYRELKTFLKELNINALKQGDGIPRAKMLEDFKKDVNSVLFGVDSFWEGVDVPGEALSNVIITKLPFSVPDHPIVEARMERIRAQGKDPFYDYSLPEAVLKLKQGFGRLIRTKYDRGIVVILDSRILRRPYGGKFLSALPKCEIIIED